MQANRWPRVRRWILLGIIYVMLTAGGDRLGAAGLDGAGLVQAQYGGDGLPAAVDYAGTGHITQLSRSPGDWWTFRVYFNSAFTALIQVLTTLLLSSWPMG